MRSICIRGNRECPRYEFVGTLDVRFTLLALNGEDLIDELECEIDQRPDIASVSLQRTVAEIVTTLFFIAARLRVHEDRLATHGEILSIQVLWLSSCNAGGVNLDQLQLQGTR